MEAAEKKNAEAATEKKKTKTADGPNADAKEAKVRLTLEEREFQAARAKIEQELEKVGNPFSLARSGLCLQIQLRSQGLAICLVQLAYDCSVFDRRMTPHLSE